MKASWGAIASVAFWMAGTISAQADAEIVVAMRYLLPKGVSHAHLYLYREDGKLLRQLTRDNAGQDRNPVFAPNGETIVFTREKGKAKEIWSIEPRGGGLHHLKEAPGWYRTAHTSPYFSGSFDFPASGDKAPHIRAPDRSIELVLRVDPTDSDDEIDGEGHGRHYLIRDLNSGRSTEMGELPGFEGVYDLRCLGREEKQCFLIEGALRLAFFSLHLNSTDGDTVYALDLSGRRLVRLSPNGAAPFPLPGEPAFLTLTEVRYVDIPGSEMTANSSYVERWDAKLHRIRYAHAGAAICYGASLYRPGRKPVVVTILDH